ncbi:CoA transferase [Variovorax sp. WS11]|uniref:CoA transferase n=1 Tax=Variovorax sp. WS11 TaxID=1105204 RepID=UPI000D0D7F8C|nr:CoA transferase [Variovorax sp. WS11]NDZ18090.1 CoA transferase [Variovorax sp. WS11]PSL79254.1 CoA transferase [Variovorax sp. WS11]
MNNNPADIAPGQGKNSAFAELMAVRGRGDPDPSEVAIVGHDPFYPTPYRVGETVAAVLAGVGVAASDIWELRTGRRQSTHIDVPKAAATLRTVDYTQARNGEGRYEHVPIPNAMAHMLTVTQPWQTADGRWVLPHFNLMHLARRVLGVLACESTPASVSEAVSRWNADALEQAIADADACGGKVRTPEEWLAHPQGRYLAERPVIEIRKVAEGEPQPFHEGDRPLSGVRVLDLTRILAGPIAGRTLAEHGADVLMVTADGLPQTPEHVRDTSHGKRSCFLDITQPPGAAKLADLVRGADVFIDGYRPDRLAAHGFGPEDLRRLNPNLVYVSINCFGSGGPFASRAGWEQVAQAVTGICHTNGELTGAGRPKLVFAPMCDYTTGYLGGFGAMLALARRAREGGSYHVQISLCQSAMFIQRQGLVDDFEGAAGKLGAEEAAPMMVASSTCYGELKTLGPVLGLSETPSYWARPTPRLGGDEPVWLER